MLSIDSNRANLLNSRRSVRTLLILRPDNLGDVVLFSGALRHIRSHFEKAKITLCVKRSVINYVELCPYVDEIICWEDMVRELAFTPTINWIPDVRGKWRLEKTLRTIAGLFLSLKYRSDLLLLPVRSPTGGENGMHAIVNRLPARTKYGIAGDWTNQSMEEDELSVDFYTERLVLSPTRSREHELCITRDFLRLIGIEVELEDLWPDNWTSSTDREWASCSIPTCDDGTRIAICPGAKSFSGKIYPSAKIAEAFSHLSRLRFRVILLGDEEELEQCKSLEKLLLVHDNILEVTNLAGKSTIRQFVETLKLTDIILSQDSAGLHIATALRKPTVGILGGGHFGRFYPWGDSVINRVVNNPMDCYWCSWICKFPTIRCIQEISSERVATEIRNLAEHLSHSPDYGEVRVSSNLS